MNQGKKSSTERVRCSHILLKHTQSRRPFDSYRNKKVTRSKDEAMNEIQQILTYVQTEGTKNFAQIAKEKSECSSAANGGDLGDFGRGEMQQAFENAAFALSVNGLSGIVDSDSGLHIILRTG